MPDKNLPLDKNHVKKSIAKGQASPAKVKNQPLSRAKSAIKARRHRPQALKR